MFNSSATMAGCAGAAPCTPLGGGEEVGTISHCPSGPSNMGTNGLPFKC